MLKSFCVCLVMVALLPAVAYGQSSRMCSVGAVWWHLGTGVGSGNMLLGEFAPSVSREPIIKRFKYYDTGLIVSVGVRYVYPEKSSKPDFIELALAVSDKEEEKIFLTPNNAMASLLYKKGWRHFSVSQNVTHDERLNTFKLHCWESEPNRR